MASGRGLGVAGLEMGSLRWHLEGVWGLLGWRWGLRGGIRKGFGGRWVEGGVSEVTSGLKKGIFIIFGFFSSLPAMGGTWWLAAWLALCCGE